MIHENVTYEMAAYVIHDGHKRIAWSKTKVSSRPAPILLTREFLGELKELK